MDKTTVALCLAVFVISAISVLGYLIHRLWRSDQKADEQLKAKVARLERAGFRVIDGRAYERGLDEYTGEEKRNGPDTP